MTTQENKQETNADFLGVEAPTEHANVQIPFIQMLRGDLKTNGPIGTGAFELPANKWEMLLGDTHKLHTIVSPSGGERQSYLLTSLNIAIMAQAQLWFIPGDNFMPIYQKGYTPGAKGKFRVLAYIKELQGIYDDMVMLTVSGMAGKFVKQALQQFRDTTLATANSMGSTKYPDYFFWCHLLCTGKKEDVGSGATKNYITPPSLAYNKDDVSQEFVSKAFVGKNLVDKFMAGWDYAQQWKGAQYSLWKSNQPGYDPEAIEPTPDPEAPFVVNPTVD